MPIIKSAKKANRQNVKKKARNDYFRSVYREIRVSFEKAIKDSDVNKAKELYYNQKDKDGKNIKSGLQSVIDKLCKKNIIHKNNASRKKSKFVKMIKSIDTAK